MDRMEKSAHVGKWNIIHKRKRRKNISFFRLRKNNVLFHTTKLGADMAMFNLFFVIASEHENILFFDINIKFNKSTN